MSFARAISVKETYREGTLSTDPSWWSRSAEALQSLASLARQCAEEAELSMYDHPSAARRWSRVLASLSILSDDITEARRFIAVNAGDSAYALSLQNRMHRISDSWDAISGEIGELLYEQLNVDLGVAG